jgi:hypothetical protein
LSALFVSLGLSLAFHPVSPLFLNFLINNSLLVSCKEVSTFMSKSVFCTSFQFKSIFGLFFAQVFHFDLFFSKMSCRSSENYTLLIFRKNGWVCCPSFIEQVETCLFSGNNLCAIIPWSSYRSPDLSVLLCRSEQ